MGIPFVGWQLPKPPPLAGRHRTPRVLIVTEPNLTLEEHEEGIQFERDYLRDLHAIEPYIWAGVEIISGFMSLVMILVAAVVSGLPRGDITLDPHMAVKISLWVLAALLVIQWENLAGFEKKKEGWDRQINFVQGTIREREWARDREYPPDTPDQ